MIKNKNYVINNIYNKKIAIFSDIHYSSSFDNSIFLEIINNLNQNKPDYICIIGDIVDDSKYLDIEIIRNRLKNFFKKLGLIAPTFIIQGNHDQITINKRKSIVNIKEDFFRNLGLFNVHYLSNNSVIINDFNFIGFNPSINYYIDFPYENTKNLKKEFKKIENLVKKNKCNILLFHSPIKLTSKDMIKEINNFDLIISGHMHNGMLPKFLDNINSNIGIISPYKKLFPTTSRGLIKINNTNIVISGGILKMPVKYTKKMSLLKYNRYSHIEYILL